MKYKDIPSVESTLKLIQISFADPSKNIAMYRIYVKLKEHQGFLENEKNKLLKIYGTESEKEPGVFKLQGENLVSYRNEWGKILESDINDIFDPPGFELEDFNSENCSYPQEKQFWPNAADISMFISFCDNMKQESVNRTNE